MYDFIMLTLSRMVLPAEILGLVLLAAVAKGIFFGIFELLILPKVEKLLGKDSPKRVKFQWSFIPKWAYRGIAILGKTIVNYKTKFRYFE